MESMRSRGSGVLHFLYRYIVYGLFFAVLVYLTFLSSFSTCGLICEVEMLFPDEKTFFLTDSVVRNLLAVFGTAAGLFALKRIPSCTRWLERIEQDEALFKKLRHPSRCGKGEHQGLSPRLRGEQTVRRGVFH